MDESRTVLATAFGAGIAIESSGLGDLSAMYYLILLTGFLVSWFLDGFFREIFRSRFYQDHS